LTTSLDDCRLDLFDLWNTNALNLTFTDTIPVENDSGRIRTIVTLEALQSFSDAVLQSCGPFLTNLILDNTRGPVGGC
jgi:hypothetical protein